MQDNYQRFFLKRQPKAERTLPVDEYPLNRLVAVGSSKGRLLCRVRKVSIEVSEESQLKQGNKEGKRDPDAGKYWYKRFYLF